MYGVELPKDAKGQIDNGIGKDRRLVRQPLRKTSRKLMSPMSKKSLTGLPWSFYWH
jgi:alkyl sulfatase BDS1-like metallo-beta-lactamase superfamily hydrolase